MAGTTAGRKLHEHGAIVREGKVTFSLWAPRAHSVGLDVEGQTIASMRREDDGWFVLEKSLAEIPLGSRYGFRLDDSDRVLPDPASRSQPEGVHARSELIAADFSIRDSAFLGHALKDLVIEEVHAGTFTPVGTLDAAIRELPRLRELGVNAVELMPLAAFDGSHGWGYDGVQPFAVHAPYGGPEALARFVEAAHALSLSVILDVVYNHFGPSGCYEAVFAPWFSQKRRTPWGDAVDYSRPAVRDFFVQNALFWIQRFHVDGLRLDAVHAIRDDSEKHILAEIAEAVSELPPRVPGAVKPFLIGESHLNDASFVRPKSEGGMGLGSQWSDDLHHALHASLTHERQGYYLDYGRAEDVRRALTDGQTYTGQHSAVWKGPHGTPTDGLSGENFVVFAQNHDQVGNRARGERLPALVSGGKLRLAAAACLLSPFIPMLFMGEAWAEEAPFLYFTDFPDAALGRAVSEGRRRGFSPEEQKLGVPDPQERGTFERSKIHPGARLSGRGRDMWLWHRTLIALRKSFADFTAHRVGQPPEGEIENILSKKGGTAFAIVRPVDGLQTALCLNLSDRKDALELGNGTWELWADSALPEETCRALAPLLEGKHLSACTPILRTGSGGEIALPPFGAAFLTRC